MTIRYRDVSHFQGPYQPTGPTVAKATQWLPNATDHTYTDPEFAGIRTRTRAGGWPFLAYHFLGHGSIPAQVAQVVAAVGHGQPLMLDVESQTGQPDATLDDVYAFADAYKAAGGRVTLAYLPEWYWANHIGHPPLTGLDQRGIGLVSSLYGHGYSDNGPGWDDYQTTQHGVTFHGGVKPVIWQFSDAPLDTNAFRGTQAQLADLWANGTADNTNPSVPVQEPDMPLTQADADLVVNTLILKGLGAHATPTVGVALQSTYNAVTTMAAAQDPAKLAAALAPLLANADQVTPEVIAQGLHLFAQQVATQAPSTAG